MAVIARVPFDEGTLTGTLTHDTTWPKDDWRNTYFVPENLHASVDRAEALKPLVPAGMTMAEMALRFILNEPTVSTIIPGCARRLTWRPTSPSATPRRSPRTFTPSCGATAGTGRRRSGPSRETRRGNAGEFSVAHLCGPGGGDAI